MKQEWTQQEQTELTSKFNALEVKAQTEQLSLQDMFIVAEYHQMQRVVFGKPVWVAKAVKEKVAKVPKAPKVVEIGEDGQPIKKIRTQKQKVESVEPDNVRFAKLQCKVHISKQELTEEEQAFVDAYSKTLEGI